MPTVFAHHDVKDTNHWLVSQKREVFSEAMAFDGVLPETLVTLVER
jgi:hypothetical protein